MTESTNNSIHARIIHVDADPTEQSKNKRSIHVKTELIPSLARFGIDAKVHKAILGAELVVVGDTVYHGGESFRIGLDWNTKSHPSKNCVALTLTNRQIWKEVVETNTPMMVFEDDIQVSINEADMLYTKECITHFLEFMNGGCDQAILYLLSSCPWQRKQKFYPHDFLIHLTEELYQVSRVWYEMSGPAPYLITPSSAQKMLDYFGSLPIIPIDQMFILGHRHGRFRYIIPKDYTKNFSHHPVLSSESTLVD